MLCRRFWERLPDFLPGRLDWRAGDSRDYRQLARFHYRARQPATWAAVLVLTHSPEQRLGFRLEQAAAREQITSESSQAPCDRPIAIGVLSWPTAVSKPRREVFGLDGRNFGAQVRFANGHMRTISRVIVHPQFRGLGLARILIEALCAICPTRYVEATAAMAAAHPMFQRAGMTRHQRSDGGAAYFWFDREMVSG